ncbi:uncharacterized protein CXQ87_004044 [Candidozyma duobushaemuli]|nr:uncharacterized protein CXQ87_004044 [[Candida] duobushaemulonis]PVH16176.1 hypothetical protein CXQ87_004044 [[Candida] duobushaemulonis]
MSLTSPSRYAFFKNEEKPQKGKSEEGEPEGKPIEGKSEKDKTKQDKPKGNKPDDKPESGKPKEHSPKIGKPKVEQPKVDKPQGRPNQNQIISVPRPGWPPFPHFMSYQENYFDWQSLQFYNHAFTVDPANRAADSPQSSVFSYRQAEPSSDGSVVSEPSRAPKLPIRGRPRKSQSPVETPKKPDRSAVRGEGLPGTIWLYTTGDQVRRNQPEYAGNLDFGISQRYAASNPAAEVSRQTLATVRSEFAATDAYRASSRRRQKNEASSDGSVRKKRKLNGCEWKPESLYKTYSECKPEFFDGSDYNDHVPASSCFGLINMRAPKAWRRGPRKHLQQRSGTKRVRARARPKSPEPSSELSPELSPSPEPSPSPEYSPEYSPPPPQVTQFATESLNTTPEAKNSPKNGSNVPKFTTQAEFEAEQASARARSQQDRIEAYCRQ